MKHTRIIYLFTACIIGISLHSCKKKTVELVDTSEDLTIARDTANWSKIDSIKLNSDNLLEFNVFLKKGATWKAWEKVHKDCMESAWFRHPVYMGVSNTIGLGTIINRDNTTSRPLSSAYDTIEVKKYIQKGEFQNCSFTQQLNVNVNVLLQGDVALPGEMQEGVAAELTAAIQSSKGTSLKIENWRVNNLYDGLLKEDLEGSAEQKKKNFLSDLRDNGGKLIIVKETEIKGFKTILKLEKEMSAGLQASLQPGVAATVGSGALDAKLTIVNSREIQMTSTGNVFVFTEMKKGKKL
jgi:hypothetical protein